MSRSLLSDKRVLWTVLGAAMLATAAALIFLFAPSILKPRSASPSLVQQKSIGEGLAPAAELPPPTMEGAENSESLLKRYPRDPRVRYLRFVYYVTHENFDRAEQEIDQALANEALLNRHVPDGTMPQRFVYAIFLHGRGKIDEARAVASPVCAAKGEKLDPLRAKLIEASLCS